MAFQSEPGARPTLAAASVSAHLWIRSDERSGHSHITPAPGPAHFHPRSSSKMMEETDYESFGTRQNNERVTSKVEETFWQTFWKIQIKCSLGSCANVVIFLQLKKKKSPTQVDVIVAVMRFQASFDRGAVGFD
uniref:Uncharacterized protein n=1 Tax=Knipowitschia caucasica TaxID=637954 RepID=A0AAV2LBD4_KNICA